MSEPERSVLPKSWCWARLGDLGDWAGGGTPSKFNAAFWKDGSIPWVSPKDMKSFEIFDSEDHITEDAIRGSATTLLPPNTVLVVTRSGILRHTFPVAVARVPVTLNQDLKAIAPHDGVSPAYLARALSAFGQRIIHSCSKDGTTVQSIETSLLRSFQIPIAPANEQERILDALDELLSDLDAGVAALERVRAKLKHYRAAVLKAAVEGTLTAEWRRQHPATETADALLTRIIAERRRLWEESQLKSFEALGKAPPKDWKAKYLEPVLPDTTGLPTLGEGALWVSLDQIAAITGGVTKGQKVRDGVETRDVAYLRVANVQRGYLDLSEIKRIRATEQDIEALRLLPGDVLFNEGGDRDKLGRGWIWEGQIEECVHQNHVFRARLHVGDVRPKIVSWAGNSYGQKWFMRTGKQSVNLASINMTVLRSFPVPLFPAAEQDAIVEAIEDQLSVIDHLGHDLERRLKGAQALRQSILRHAFTGQLLPQHANDEPASELLKRITIEREERTRLARAAKQANPRTRAPRSRAGKQ